MEYNKFEFPKYKDLISIIPGGIIQFLDIPVKLSSRPRLNIQFKEITGILKSGVTLNCFKNDSARGHFIDARTNSVWIDPLTGEEDASVEPDYGLSSDRVLDTYLNKWIPIPFLRSVGRIGINEERFRFGPTDWARAQLIKVSIDSDDSIQYHLVIAFDTQIENDIDVPNVGPETGYPCLSLMDVIEGAELSFVTDIGKLLWFTNLSWVNDWLNELFLDSIRNNNNGKVFREVDLEYNLEHVARYIGFIEFLSQSTKIPRVRIIDTNKNVSPIDVDLVVDIGNARTIGMLVERRDSGSSGLDDGAILEIRDLSSPTDKTGSTFSSTICFSKFEFGDHNGFSRGSGRIRPGFQWPSSVRIGDEAERLSSLARKELGLSSMSSPKRYLWDMRPSKQEWRNCVGYENVFEEETPVNTGEFVGYINNYGFPLKALHKRPSIYVENWSQQPNYPVIEPLFCRSSLMMFLFAELLTQTLVQINSPSYRNDRGLSDIPRKLRRVLITYPPAMSDFEKKYFKQWADWAIDVLWSSLSWDDSECMGVFNFSKPVTKMNLDEASASQLVFIFNEIVKRFSGDAENYFKNFGRQRNQYKDISVRIASIDIGGGTTDMVVTTYRYEQVATSIRLLPFQNFREGFNFAGDDLLKTIIEGHILAKIASKCCQDNIDLTEENFYRKFIKDAVDMKEREKNIRGQFTKHILKPIAIEILQKLEELGHNYLQGVMFSVKLSEIFKKHKIPSAEVLNYVGLINTLRDGNSYRDIELDFDLGEISVTIVNCIEPYLKELIEIIGQYDCDFLLVSGRPSCLPSIQKIFYKYAVMPASRIIPMGNYQVDNWYPFFTKPDGRIADPKTTGVVGAMLSAISEGYLKNFYFKGDDSNVVSTVRFIGAIGNAKKIENKNIFFGGRDLLQVVDEKIYENIKYISPMHIGFRQMNVERWTVTPFYYLSFSSSLATEKSASRLPYEITISYTRENLKLEEFENQENVGMIKIESITDKDGQYVNKADLILTMQTLWYESHWLDSGLFELV
jgi:hypothetical protein